MASGRPSDLRHRGRRGFLGQTAAVAAWAYSRTAHGSSVDYPLNPDRLSKRGTYMTAVVMDSAGLLVERYGKVYLAGEKWAVPDNHIAFFRLAGTLSTVIVFHDCRYPELVRLPALQGAWIAYSISYDSTLQHILQQKDKIPALRAQLVARAVENRVFLEHANSPADDERSGSNGGTRIIGSDGTVLAELPYFGQGFLVRRLKVGPGKLTRPLENALLGDWWRQGVEIMQRHRPHGLA